MKKLFFITILLCVSASLFAQDALDALRYSYLTNSGTARIQAIGGAQGSLGGDISATFVNPAGLGFYKTNEFVFSPAFQSRKNKITYNDQQFSESSGTVAYGTTGFIFSTGSPSYRNNSWKNFTFSIGINQSANFNSKFNYSGLNNFSSYSEKWVEELVYRNVTNPNDAAQLFANGASLALNTFLIDTANNEQGIFSGYKTNANSFNMNFNQEFQYEERGGMNDVALGLAGNLKDKVYLGAAINIPIVYYKRKTVINETDATNNPDNDFASMDFTETLITKGAGIQGKLGLIFKPVDYVRLGLAFHTPTFFTLEDNTNANLTANTENYVSRVYGINESTWSQDTKTVTGGDDFIYRYNLTTPWRLIASASYVFREVQDVTKQKAFITADVELVNYKAASFSPDTQSDYGTNDQSYFDDVNTSIDNLFKAAINARVGGELKFKIFMVRAGFAYYGSPYKQSDIKGNRMQYSGGLGYRDKGVFVDLTYVYTDGKDIHIPYLLVDSAYPLAKNKLTRGNAVFTVGFKF